MKNLPLYKISISLEDETTGMTCISLVDFPAIERNFICFEEQKPFKFKTDESKHHVFGPAIICDLPIYRRNPDGYEYMVVFDKETIETIVEKYSMNNLWNNVNLSHSDEAYQDGVVMVGMFIKDETKGVNPLGFEDVTDGSLFVEFKIQNESLWEEIVNGSEFRGFSIETFANLIPAEFHKQEQPKEETFEEWVDSFVSEKKKVH